MKASLTMLLYLVSDMLDIKAIKNRTFTVRNEVFCPRDVLKKVFCTTKILASHKNLSFKLKFIRSSDHHIGKDSSLSALQSHVNKLKNIDFPKSLNGDWHRFEQIMINLIKNAIKFTRIGLILIVVSYDAHEEKL